MRVTRIWATLGPATSSEDSIRRLAEAGADALRLNFSHLSHDEALLLVEAAREVARKIGRPLPLCLDLQGAKVRIGLMAGGQARLTRGQRFTLTTLDTIGDESRATVSQPDLPRVVGPGARILLDDASVQLEVLDTSEYEIHCRVVVGGLLASRKGVSIRGLDRDAEGSRAKDAADVAFAGDHRVDWVWLSFVSRSSDVRRLRQILKNVRVSVPIVAKIETGEGLANLDSILVEADGICLARGDLGAEIPIEKVPAAQKAVAAACRGRGKPLILGGQVLHSMIHNPIPLRSEALDVFNAVLDGFNEIVLSGETAIGDYPEEAVRVLSALIEEAEGYVRGL